MLLYVFVLCWKVFNDGIALFDILATRINYFN